MENKINVVFCIDGSYVVQLAVVISSLFIHNSSNVLNVYIVSSSINSTDQSKLNTMAKQFGRHLNFIDIDATRVAHLQVMEHVSQAMYYRLFLPSLLPELRKVLYFDCDIIIESDITDLWETNTSGYGCAGWVEGDPVGGNRLGIADDAYVNSGIMVLNLDYWREHGVTAKCMQWLESNPEIALLPDQDAINVVLRGAKKDIDIKWNLNPLSFSTFEGLSKHPARILHFTGPVKPWQKWYDFDVQAIYSKYVAFTPWHAEFAPVEPTNPIQAVLVANQHYLRENLELACKYYRAAIHFSLLQQNPVGALLNERIVEANRIFNDNRFAAACEFYRSCMKIWGYPLEHKMSPY